MQLQTIRQEKMKVQVRLVIILLLTAILTCIGGQSFGQNRMEISYTQTCAKCVHFILKIDITKKDTEYKIKVKYSTYQQVDIDTTYSIATVQFEQIIKSIKKISPADMLENIDFSGKDGGTSNIEFGTYANKISYDIWTPTYNTDKRRLNSFVDACRQILILAKLNPDDILK